ncbi:MerR family transcriptional regulator [Rhodococcus daqingensis]|uniref:MerR family transcriptional regulator n=1 Tax=Rhodococcus daqingensis TaxID=2479363 RepID=A0ABW2RY96_9NOCA
MRIGELSARSGISTPTIKYYVREGLLHPGERSGPNQVAYGEDHLHRLKLVRALIEVGGLSVADTRTVVDLINSPERGTFEAVGKAQYAMTPAAPAPAPAAPPESLDEVDRLLTRWGWQVKEGNPARETAAAAIATLRRMGQERLLERIDTYAKAAAEVATTDVEAMLALGDRESMSEAVVVWTMVGDQLMSALRRLASEAEAYRLTRT